MKLAAFLLVVRAALRLIQTCGVVGPLLLLPPECVQVLLRVVSDVSHAYGLLGLLSVVVVVLVFYQNLKAVSSRSVSCSMRSEITEVTSRVLSSLT
jgi:hypothetical protein